MSRDSDQLPILRELWEIRSAVDRIETAVDKLADAPKPAPGMTSEKMFYVAAAIGIVLLLPGDIGAPAQVMDPMDIQPPKWKSSIVVDAPPLGAKHVCTDCRDSTHWIYYSLGSAIYAVLLK